jgi:hypothetical protein
MDKEPNDPTVPTGPEFAFDPVPTNAIRLRDAFYRVLEANLANPTMVTLKDSERAEIRSNTESDLKHFVGEDYPVEDLEYFARGKEANVFLRNCVAAGDLVAHVRDPETGEFLQLTRKGWDDIEFIPGELGWLDSDHVHPDDPLYPGPPDVMVRGKARPVFFLRDEFERWFQRTIDLQPPSDQHEPALRKYGPASSPEIREVLREIYRVAGNDPPHMEKAWKLVQPKLPNARRNRVRDVLHEDEFASQRRKPGKKSSRQS